MKWTLLLSFLLSITSSHHVSDQAFRDITWYCFILLLLLPRYFTWFQWISCKPGKITAAHPSHLPSFRAKRLHCLPLCLALATHGTKLQWRNFTSKKIWEQTSKVSKSHKSGPPNQHSSQPDPNEIIIGGLFFQNIISKKTWGIHWIHHLLQVMAVHLENSARGNEFGSEFIGRFLLQKHPGDDCRSPWCSNLPMFFPLFFGVFFFGHWDLGGFKCCS